MDKKMIILPTALLLCLQQVTFAANTYRAAVVEYSPVTSKNESLGASENLENIRKFMEEAVSKKVDIIAFPEYALWLRTIYSPVPDPAERICPCDSKKFNTTQIVRDLSCAAKKHAIYTMVNLLEKRTCKKGEPCPPSGFYRLNTNVVFDRNGTVIARYAKFNVYNEPLADRPKTADISFFDTDFGVRFGLLTSFDIHFAIPGLRLIQQYHITDFILPCYWFSELPFLTALQIYRGWAETNDVNLLVPGLNYPLTASFGSGIFHGKKGHLVQFMEEATNRKLIIADVPKKGKQYEEIQEAPRFSSVVSMNVSENFDEKVNFIRDQLHRFTSEIVKSGQPFQKSVCSNENFCCKFRIIYDALRPESKNYTFRAVAYNGMRTFGAAFKAGIQSCGVVLCEGPDIMSCTNRMKNTKGLFKVRDIQIKGDFKLRNSFQIPSTLTQGRQLEPMSVGGYKFIKTEKDKNMVVSLELSSPVTNLLAFAIWGRDFTKDV